MHACEGRACRWVMDALCAPCRSMACQEEVRSSTVSVMLLDCIFGFGQTAEYAYYNCEDVP